VPTPIIVTENTLCFGGFTVDTITHLGIAWEPETHSGKFEWLNALTVFQDVHALISAAAKSSSLPVTMSMTKWLEGSWRIPIADQYTNDVGLRVRHQQRLKKDGN
jgi:hypothetical protein